LISSHQTPTSGPTFEVLLVEDNAADAHLTVTALAATGAPHHVTVVEDGLDALRLLDSAGRGLDAPVPNLVLLDLNLPGLHGCDVLSRLRADAELGSVPVVILSTSADQMDVARCYALGANAFVTKPMGLEEYRDMISALARFWLTTAVPRPTESYGPH